MSTSTSDLQLVPPNSRSDERFLFMFVRRTDDGLYILYKIDVFSLLRQNLIEEKLSPLIVFTHHVLPNSNFTFEFIEPNFYIIGQDKSQVFTLNKYKLLKLNPSESMRGSNFLRPISPMFGEKLIPLAFTYKDRLFVISKAYYPLLEQIGRTIYDFEVYSPSKNTWTRLGNKPVNEILIKSHLILKDMLYFTTLFEVVLSYNLERESWVSIFDPNGVLVRCPEISRFQPRPTFDTQIQLVGNMVLGGFFRFREGYFDISASLAIHPHDDTFLRPTLAQDINLFKQIHSRPRELNQLLSQCSKYIFTINENLGIICVITYGNDPFYSFSNYAVLNFFKVTGNCFKCDLPPKQVQGNESSPIPFCWNSTFGYAHDEDEEHVNFFEAEFISTTFMPINTKRQATPGVIYSCMLV